MYSPRINEKTDFLYFTNPRDLSNNSLTGGVPEFLANMKSLSIM